VATSAQVDGIAIGNGATVTAPAAAEAAGIAIGVGSVVEADSDDGIALGNTATAGDDLAIAIGAFSDATAAAAIAIGGDGTTGAQASGIDSIALGVGNASADRAISLGADSAASAADAVAVGQWSDAGNIGALAYASGRFAAAGDAQSIRFVCRGSTTGATPTNINPDGGTTNRMILPIDTLWKFTICLSVREQATGDSQTTEYRGALRRDGTTNTTLIGSVVESSTIEDAGAAGWSAIPSADDTLEALQIEVTGEAVHTLRWVAVVDITQVSG